MSRILTPRTVVDGQAKTPGWYWDWTPPEFSEEEELFLERLAMKVKENAAQEEMTPFDRLVAADSGKMPDRVPLFSGEGESLANVRVLDCWANALKVIDMYRYPKVNLIAQLAWIATFGHDAVTPYTLCYGEAEWGGKVKYLENGSPVLDEPALKDPAAVDELVIPDPKKDGRYPAYLWLVRQIREWVDKYEVPILIEASICTGPATTAGLLRGWKDLLIDMRRNTDLVHKLVQKTSDFTIRYGNAVVEAGAHALYTCDEGMQFYPPSLFKELVPYFEKCNEQIPTSNVWLVEGPNTHLEIIASAKGTKAVGQDHRDDLEEAVRIAGERDLFFEIVPDAEIIRHGDEAEMEAEYKRLLKALTKYGYKFAIAILPDYYTPPENIHKWMEIGRRLGRFPLTF